MTDLYGDPLPTGVIARMGTVRFRHEGPVSSVAFSPDGKVIASGSDDMTIRLWDAASGKELLKIEEEDPIRSVAFSPDGTMLVSGCGNTIRLRDGITGRELRKYIGHDMEIRSVAISPDGKKMASGGLDKTIRIWETATGRELLKIEGHADSVWCVAFSPDGKTVASGGEKDEKIHVWAVDTGKELARYAGHKETVRSVVFSRDGKMVASGSEDQTIRVWDVASGKERFKLLVNHPENSDALGFSPNGKILASGDFYIRTWDLATENMLLQISKYALEARSIAFSPDGKMLAVGGAWNNSVSLLDTATGEERFTAAGHHGCAQFLVYSPDGKTLISGGKDHTLRFWEATTGKHILQIEASPDHVFFTKDGKALTSGRRGDGMLHLWDVKSGEDQLDINEEPLLSNPAAVSPDGKIYATECADRTIRLYDIGTGKEVLRISKEGDWIQSMSFSPDGSVLGMLNGDHTISLLDVATGKDNLKIEPRITPHIIGFSADWRTVAVGGYNGTVLLLDMTTGKELIQLAGHTASVFAIASSTDGKVIITGSEDGTIRFWEVATAAEIHAIRSRAGDIGSLAFSPDGRHLASGHSNTTVMIWDVEALFTADYGNADSLDALWTGLATDTVPKAFAAILALQHGGREAVACLRSKLKPPSLSEDQIQRIQRMLDDLNHEDIVSRDRAEQELLATGDVAVTIVKEAVEKTGSAELKLRANRILEVLQRPLPIPPGEALRRWRAIQVLERIGSKEAQDVLEMLEKESPSLRERREAKAALDRLNRK